MIFFFKLQFILHLNRQIKAISNLHLLFDIKMNSSSRLFCSVGNIFLSHDDLLHMGALHLLHSDWSIGIDATINSNVCKTKQKVNLGQKQQGLNVQSSKYPPVGKFMGFIQGLKTVSWVQVTRISPLKPAQRANVVRGLYDEGASWSWRL